MLLGNICWSTRGWYDSTLTTYSQTLLEEVSLFSTYNFLETLRFFQKKERNSIIFNNIRSIKYAGINRMKYAYEMPIKNTQYFWEKVKNWINGELYNVHRLEYLLLLRQSFSLNWYTNSTSFLPKFQQVAYYKHTR